MDSTTATVVPTHDTERSLQELFGYPSFRDGQREVVDAVLAGDDVLAVFPTGAGKSLLYQLPALLLPGATIAVSPLIALMKDQLDQLLARGMPAAVLNSALDLDEQWRTLDALRSGAIKLLFVSPERFQNRRFQTALERVRVSLFAVDEAHCVSEWGHDFRPEYAQLGDAARALGRPPILAVTATATERVRQDIAASLGLRPNHRVFVRGFDRPNLRLSVVPASGEADKASVVADAVRSKPEGSLIAYCSTRKSCEKLAGRLQSELGQRVLVYHAGLVPDVRSQVQNAWSSGTARLVVATNAFGLGINKDDVRLVVHYEVPGSLEAYYQEAGRAGRDGKPADCTLVFSPADAHTQRFLIDASYPDRTCVEEVWLALLRVGRARAVDPGVVVGALGGKRRERVVGAALRVLARMGFAEDREGFYRAATAERELPAMPQLERRRAFELEKLDRVLAYARTATCRRETLLAYFGAARPEGAPRGTCGQCDRCQPGGELLSPEETVIVVKKVLSMVARLRSRFGRGVVARLLAGKLQAGDEDRGFSSIPTVGALKPWSVEACGGAIDSCLAEGYLALKVEDERFTKVVLTAKGHEALFDRAAITLPLAKPRTSEKKRTKSGTKSKKKAERPPVELDEVGTRVLEDLRAWRRERAKADRVPAYCVFHDRVLEELARARPTDRVALASIAGSRKAEKYGDALLPKLGG